MSGSFGFLASLMLKLRAFTAYAEVTDEHNSSPDVFSIDSRQVIFIRLK